MFENGIRDEVVFKQPQCLFRKVSPCVNHDSEGRGCVCENSSFVLERFA